MPAHIPAQDIELRIESVRHLLELEQQNTDIAPHRKTVARAYGVDEKTVKRWMDNARAHGGTYTPAQRRRFTLTANMIDEVAIQRGNINATFQRLTTHPYEGDPPLPCLATFYSAVDAAFDKAFLEGLRHGECAARRYTVHGQEIFDHRNQVWEGDHVQASVWVNVDGRPAKPWITWFIDGFTKVVPGKSITPGFPNSGSIMAAARAALARGGPYGPFGGRPKTVRIDRGADFLSTVVSQAFGNLGVPLHPLPPRRPDRKGTVEGLNSAVKSNLFQGLPGFVDDAPPGKQPRTRPSGSKKPASTDGLMSFKDFVTEVERWIDEWNHQRPKPHLGDRTPAQAWDDDLTVIFDIDAEALHTYTLAGPDKPRKITNKGVSWKSNRYIAPWMNDDGLAGTLVMLRHMPNQDREVELYDATTGKHLGSAVATDQATPQQRREVRQAADRKATQIRRKRDRAEQLRIERHAPVTDPQHPQYAQAMSHDQLQQHLHELGEPEPTVGPASQDDLLPLPVPTPIWAAAAPTGQAPKLPRPHTAEPFLPLPPPTASWGATSEPPAADAESDH
jgi:putative transposase